MCSQRAQGTTTGDDGETTKKPRRITRRRLLWTGGILAGGAVAAVGGGATAYYGTRYPAGEDQTGQLAIRGATALVGLIDTHVHMLFPQTDPGEEFGLSDTAGFIWDVARYMPGVRREFLEHGVTTVRDVGGDLEWARDLRGSIDDGTLEGPRLFFAGPILTTPGGHPLGTTEGVPEEAVRILETPQDAREAIAELCEGGQPADVIKGVHDSGGSDTPPPPTRARGAPRRERNRSPFGPVPSVLTEIEVDTKAIFIHLMRFSMS